MGADIKPIVNFIRPKNGSRRWKENGCMTNIVETKKSTKVAMENPLIVVIIVQAFAHPSGSEAVYGEGGKVFG